MSASNPSGLIPEIAKFIETKVKPVIRFIVHLRVPTTISAAAYLAFAGFGQTQTLEVYRSIALDENSFQAILATFFVAILTIFAWYTARFFELQHTVSLLKQYKSILREIEKINRLPRLSVDSNIRDEALDASQKIPDSDKVQKWWGEWIPRLLGITPLLGLFCGVWSAQSTLKYHNIFLWIWLICIFVLSVTILYFFVNRVELANRSKYLQMIVSTTGVGLFDPIFEIVFVNIACSIFSVFSLPLITAATGSQVTLGMFFVLLVTILFNIFLYFWHKSQIKNIQIAGICSVLISFLFLFIPSATAMPSLVGSIGVVAISLTILVVAFSTIFNWGNKNNIPALTILIILVLLSSFFGWNDNHQFRQFTKTNSQIPSLESSFQKWLASRKDLDKYTEKPYPVYVASAQGGGVFAAYHAATAFTKLTEYIPDFPQHIFAISGVSGGSLGSATFTSLVKESDGKYQDISIKAHQILNQDLLSPLLAMGLFPDFIQKFFPWPAIYDWDRAAGLEIAFENAWDQNIPSKSNPLKQSFYKHWQPEGTAPALVLNTTVVESGERLLISPFKILLPTKENITLDEDTLDLRLSTAAVLSARFPYVTPVGWYQHGKDGQKSRLSDGGYFDNSGIPTAIDIGRTLQQIDGYGKKFEIIYLALVGQPMDESTNIDSPKSSNTIEEIMSPIQALFNAREARSRSAVELSTYTINDRINDPFKLKFRTLMLQKTDNGVTLPLGWLISSRLKKFIAEQTPAPSKCNIEEFNKAFNATNVMDVYNHNSCVAKSIKDDLR